MTPGFKKAPHANHDGLCDALFLLAAAALAWLSLQGIVVISGRGAELDSDLQTYAQGMARVMHAASFAADPALHAATPANSIPNLERLLGESLAPPDDWAVGLLRAGAVAIFVFYAGWYALGRWLYRSPALAALLALVCGITVWVGWGTFWGISHSDPVPRVFFAAILPFLLWLGLFAIKRPALRPAAMLASGLAIWVHGVSALNFGAMLFVAYLFLPAATGSASAHARNLFYCLAAFFAPVLLFLWPELSSARKFSPDELAVFHDLFGLRWQEDYGRFFKRLASFLNPAGPAFPILAGGMSGWIVLLFIGSEREKTLCRAAPCFLVALALVTVFSWLETEISPALGRLPMGHELVRGLRFLVPISWLLIVGGIGCLTGRNMRRLILCGAFVALALLTHDRQIMAAQYALARMTGFRLPLADKADLAKREAMELAEVIKRVEKSVPPGEAVYCPEDAMQVRYMALRPLAHSFKDGYLHFYNRDVERSKKWLELEKLARSGPAGYLRAWQASGAPWLLCRANVDKEALEANGEIEWRLNGWLLVRKSAANRPSGA